MVDEKEKKQHAIPYLVGVLLLILSILSIALLVVFWETEDVTHIRGRFGIVFDAGGSGTRVHVYEYTKNERMKEIKYIKCEKKGLSNYGTNMEEVSNSLQNCLQKAAKEIPLKVVSETPLYVGATGGMRMLREKNTTLFHNVWDTVRDVLRNSSFPVKLARTLYGKEEGAYSWSTVNNLLQNNKNTSGVYELGSSSFQISFEPRLSKQNIPDDYKKSVEVNEQKYEVYAHSYLCFGKTEFARRYKATLVKNSGFSSIVQDPCAYNGFQENVTSSYLYQSPCVSGDYARDHLGESIEGKQGQQHTLNGTGSFQQCFQTIQSMFNMTNCGDSCSVNGIYQPTAKGLFTAIGGGVYHSSKYLNLNTPTNTDAYRNATKLLCSKSYETIKNTKDYSRYVNDYCLADSYNLFLFTNVLKLGNQDKLMFADDINDQSITWTLGLMYSHLKDMSKAIVKKTRELSSDVFYPLIVVSALLLIVGITLIVVNCWKRKRNHKNKEIELY